MGNCAKLKFGRKQLKMTQKQFAESVGLSVGTIAKLELDETAWATIQRETEDKIYSKLEGVSPWGFKKTDTVEKNKADGSTPKELPKFVAFDEVTQEMVEQAAKKYEEKKEIHNSLSTHDKKTLTLIEFAYEGLIEAETHEDFMANINTIKRIIKKY